MPFGLGLPELLIILVIILLIFGPSQLPKLGKLIGGTMKSIRDGVEGKDEEEPAEKAATKSESKDADAE